MTFILTIIVAIIALSFIIQWYMRAEIDKHQREGRGRKAMEMYISSTYQTTQFVIGSCYIVFYVSMLIIFAIFGGVISLLKIFIKPL